MKKKTRQRFIAGLILLHLLLPANVSFPEPMFEQHDNRFIDANISADGSPDDASVRESDRPNVQAIVLDDGFRVSTAAGFADYHGIDISDLRGSLPDWIPTTDPILFEAYLRLYDHTAPIFYGPNGIYQTSGVDLGLLIAKNKINVDWEDKNLVNCGASGKACVDRNNPDPVIASTIYIVDIGYRPVNVVDIYAGRIAHEAFHLSFPYGRVNSKVEEMDAIRIGSIIAGTNSQKDYQTPDYSSEAIQRWVTGFCANVYGVCGYENLPLYPGSGWNAQFF